MFLTKLSFTKLVNHEATIFVFFHESLAPLIIVCHFSFNLLGLHYHEKAVTRDTVANLIQLLDRRIGIAH